MPRSDQGSDARLRLRGEGFKVSEVPQGPRWAEMEAAKRGRWDYRGCMLSGPESSPVTGPSHCLGHHSPENPGKLYAVELYAVIARDSEESQVWVQHAFFLQQ